MQVTGLHIEPTNICTLKCSGCSRTRFIEQWPQHWKNHNLDIGMLMRFLDVDIEGRTISLCGNYGDPIYHPDLSGLVKALKGRGARIAMITNGSYKSKEWWKDLCSTLDADDRVTFSIDGSPLSFTIYRENAHWPSIQLAIQICVEHGVKTTWKFIPFQFNQHEIEECRHLSQHLGMNDFLVDPSDRFDERTKHLLPDNVFLGSRWQKIQEFKTSDRNHITINPKCWKHKEHFITADGFYTPCCYIADHRSYYKTFWGKDRQLFDIQNTTLSQILDRSYVVEFYQFLPEKQLRVCQYNCPASD